VVRSGTSSRTARVVGDIRREAEGGLDGFEQGVRLEWLSQERHRSGSERPRARGIVAVRGQDDGRGAVPSGEQAPLEFLAIRRSRIKHLVALTTLEAMNCSAEAKATVWRPVDSSSVCTASRTDSSSSTMEMSGSRLMTIITVVRREVTA
jgi:hypothetical protein